MTLHLKMPSTVNNLSPKISVIGVGGTGGNIVNSMIKSKIEGVTFLNVNTDSQALKHSLAEQTLQLGPNCTQGMGAGANPEVGKEAAEEVLGEIEEYLENSNMVFITAGMGGGTGTGASPVIARIARDLGILIVGVVTKPFEMEGKRRMEQATEGIKELQKYVDNLIVIPNQNIYHFAKPDTPISEALQLADNVLIDGVRSIIDLMVKPGIMNHDFADVKAVMSETGKVHMGTGISNDNERAIKATEEAISNPLLENNSMAGARGILINITGGSDITLHEVDQAVNRIREESDENANIIWGLTNDEDFNGKFKISVISTGIESENYLKNKIDDINIKEFKSYRGNDSTQLSQEDNFVLNNQEKPNESNFSEDSNLNIQQNSFFIDLTSEDKKDTSKSAEEIEALEKKAENFKTEKKSPKKSIFSKIFGNKKVIEKKIDKEIVLSNEPIENNLLSDEINNSQLKDETINFEEKYSEKTENSDFFEDNNQLEGLDHDLKSDDDLLEIPAFLRRQAN